MNAVAPVRANGRPPRKPKTWTHQDDLKNLVGREIVLMVLDDSPVRGTLLAADQFTLKIRRVCDDESVKSILTYFKHAVSGYAVVDNA